jgi:hypothetical protein
MIHLLLEFFWVGGDVALWSYPINLGREIWWGNLREGDQWGDPDVDGRLILRWIFRKWEGVVWGLDGVGSG